MPHKSLPVNIKAAGDGLADGQFRAVVSVFGNIDAYNDVVQKGAFATTLSEWKASGLPIPIYWSHMMSDPDMNLGYVVEATETDAGLEILGQLALDEPKALQVYRLMKGGRVNQFSFSYDIVRAHEEKNEEGWFFSLDELKLHEVGPTPVGANQETELLEVKAAQIQVRRFADNLISGAKAGRVLSSKNETTLRGAAADLEGALGQINTVLSVLDDTQSDGDSGKGNATSDDEKAAPTSATQTETRKGKAPVTHSVGPVDESVLRAEIELAALLASS